MESRTECTTGILVDTEVFKIETRKISNYKKSNAIRKDMKRTEANRRKIVDTGSEPPELFRREDDKPAFLLDDDPYDFREEMNLLEDMESTLLRDDVFANDAVTLKDECLVKQIRTSTPSGCRDLTKEEMLHVEREANKVADCFETQTRLTTKYTLTGSG